MWISRRGKRHRYTLEPPTEERRPAGTNGHDWASERRLAAVFKEEDEEIDARLGEKVMTAEYRFRCRSCERRFSLAQMLEAHELECGRVDQRGGSEMPGNGRRPIVCRHCGHESLSLKDHSAHLLAAHREETLARRRELAAQRKAEARDPDPAPDRIPPAPPARPVQTPRAVRADGESHPVPVAPPGSNGNGHGPTCPLCGGAMPRTTAELVAALQAEGLEETAAFAAARIARRVFCQPAAA